jgi:ABC-type transport system involved in multi-copper enzyme maturation permease subunit
MLCAASSIAEDRQIGFMKEALCQPISRIQYLGAKILALMGLSAISLFLTVLPALIFYNGTLGDFNTALSAYGICLLSDILLIEVTFFVSTFARSSGTAAIYTFLFFVFEALTRTVLSLSTVIFEEENPIYELGPQVAQWMPGAIIGAWKVWEDHWFSGYPIALLVFVFLIGFGLERRFSKLQL